MTQEKTISDLAYHLWQARGCPDGSSDIDWAAAERQVRGGVSGSTDRALDAPPSATEAPPAAAPKKAPKKQPVLGSAAVKRAKKKDKR